ncbi:MAG: MFS transporter [Acidimicrobiia bacterium]
MGVFRERLAESGRSLREVFRNPGLRKLNLALGGSVIGDWAYAVALSIYIYQRGGATAVGVFGVIRLILVALVLPYASSFADRFDRRRVLIVSDAVRMVLVAIAAVVIRLDGPPMVVYALVIMTSLASTPFRPAQAALLPRLATHPGELSAANVASSTIESLGFFLGPAIAGLLLAVTDLSTVYLFNVLTFAWSLAMVIRLRVPDRVIDGTDGDEDQEPKDESVLAGCRLILSSRDLRILVGVYAAQTIVAGASLVFGVAIALDMLEIGESGVGLLDSVLGVGGLLGGFVALLLATRGRLAGDFGLGVILWSAPLLLIAIWPNLTAAIAAMVMIGLANSIVDVNAYTILQRLVPDEVMGRVFGAMESALIASMALGSLAMPLLMETVGLRAGLAIIGGFVTGVTILALAGLRRIDSVALAPEGLRLLSGVSFFTPLRHRVMETLARESETLTLADGTIVFRKGDQGDRFYVIESGSASVSIDGRPVHELGPGDFFGEIALLTDIPRTATVTATAPLTVRTIERDAFLTAVTGHGAALQTANAVATRYVKHV